MWAVLVPPLLRNMLGQSFMKWSKPWIYVWVILAYLQGKNNNKNKKKVAFIYDREQVKSTVMSGSCHFDRASNDKFSLEFWIFGIVIFFNHDRVLKFGDPSRSHKGALTLLDPGFLRYCLPLVSQLLDPKNSKTQFSQTDMVQHW